jgi:hypothetical protein
MAIFRGVVVIRQYAAIPLIFGACLLIIEYTISSLTVIKYHDADRDGVSGLRGGEREWKVMSMPSAMQMQEDGAEGAENVAQQEGNIDIDIDVFPWAREYLIPLITTDITNTRTVNLDQEQSTQPPLPPTTTSNDTTTTTPFLFWHIAKSGGTSAKAIYKCLLGKSASILSSKVSIEKAKRKQERYNQNQKSSLSSFFGFASSPSSFTTSLSSTDVVERARGPDVMFSMIPDVVATTLFNPPSNKGRLLALFRHPVDRLISKFYYLQIA